MITPSPSSSSFRSTTTFDEVERQRLIQSIPEFSSFEHNLENIQPLQGGRRARSLVANAVATREEKQQIIDKVRASFSKELEQLDEMDDPLDAYIRHLKWTVETFPEGNNNESQLVDHLQNVTHRFQNDTRYVADPRYLNCWLEYAKWADDPKDIFVFLMKRGIGQNLALFYEQYSALLEDRKKYKEAGDMLELGIERQAQPLRRLERNREHFLQRMELRKLQEPERGSDPPVHDQIQSLLRAQRRTMLGHKLDTRAHQSVSRNEYDNIQNTVGGSGSLSSTTSSASASSRSFGNATAGTTLSSNSLPFQVFADDADASQQSTPSPSALAATLASPLSSTASSLSSPPPSSSKLSNASQMSISAFSRHRKENTVPVETFAGATLPQKASLLRPSIPKFTVFQDDGDEPESTGKDSDHPTPELPLSTKKRSRYTSEYQQRQINVEKQQPTSLSSLSRSSSSLSLSGPALLPDDETIDTAGLMAILERRFKRMEKQYIKSTDSVGNPITIAATVEYVESSGRMEPLSFEELRISRQVDRTGNSQVINGRASQAILLAQSKVAKLDTSRQVQEPTTNHTTETLIAMKSVGALFAKRSETEEEPDDDQDLSEQQLKRMKRTFADENM